MKREIVSVTYVFEVYNRKALRNAACKASYENDPDRFNIWDWARQRRDSFNTIQYDVDCLISFDTYNAGLKFRDASGEVIKV